MTAKSLRVYLILVLVLAAALSVVANKSDSAFLGWLSFAVFVCAVVLYVTWRRTALRERRANVFDREAKTDETRTRPDQ
jgi:uncharacterized membrane protein YfcA